MSMRVTIVAILVFLVAFLFWLLPQDTAGVLYRGGF